MQNKLGTLDKFDWLKLIAKLFHLQINLLIILFDQFGGKTGNIASLYYYQAIPKKTNILINMENLHAFDTFFRHMVDKYVVVQFIKTMSHKNIIKFKVWVARSN